ncbi:MAG: hypothetical protein ACI36Y_03730, partial [Coriobacteriales bacterium]
MKPTSKKTAAVVLSTALAACTALGASGCDATVNSEIDTAAGTVTGSEVISIAKSELRPVAEYVCAQMGLPSIMTDFVLEQAVADLVKEGATYSEQTGLLTFTETADTVKDELLKDSYVVYLNDLTSKLLGKFESTNVATTIDRDTLRAK